MTILELMDNINQTILDIQNSYNNLNTDLQTKLDNAIVELKKYIENTSLSKDDVKKIVADIAPTLTVKEVQNNTLLNGKTIDGIRNYIFPGYDIEAFKLIKNGQPIKYSHDPIDSKATDEGFILFCPHSKEEYEIARKYLLSLNSPKSMGPLGIYYDNDDIPGKACSNCWFSNHALNSDDMGKLGWKVVDGSLVWWASDKRNVTEPNGDYKKFAFLGITYDNLGFVKWYNDMFDCYSYNTYLTVKRKSNN